VKLGYKPSIKDYENRTCLPGFFKGAAIAGGSNAPALAGTTKSKIMVFAL
jgi:hypothetical protein